MGRASSVLINFGEIDLFELSWDYARLAVHVKESPYVCGSRNYAATDD